MHAGMLLSRMFEYSTFLYVSLRTIRIFGTSISSVQGFFISRMFEYSMFLHDFLRTIRKFGTSISSVQGFSYPECANIRVTYMSSFELFEYSGYLLDFLRTIRIIGTRLYSLFPIVVWTIRIPFVLKFCCPEIQQ